MPDSAVPTPPLFRPLPEPPPFGLVDVHAYVGEPQGNGLYGRLGQDDVIGWMDEAHVEQACAFVPKRADYGPANAALADWAGTTGGRVRFAARVGRGTSPEAAHLETAAAAMLRPHTDGWPGDEVLGVIADRRLPVLIHAGQQAPPEQVVRRLLPRTTGPIVLQHLGCHPGDAQLLRAAVALAEAEPRVYLDTGVPSMAPFVRFAADRVPGKVVFGSGMPVLHPTTAWAHVAAALPGDPGRLRAIGRDTAAALFDRVRL